ncbi:MAG: response regulator [Candidatus Omnitrophica bacterium]|nr:response regulator [Candidatus Omnitrophota bacterium]
MFRLNFFHRKRILVVNDEEDVLTIVKARLRQNGYQVLIASDGLEGLRMAQKESPDLIFVDVTIPRINGFQMVQLLRHDKLLKEIPTIVATASHHKDEVTWWAQMGIHHLLVKPFETKVLLDKIQEALKSSPLQKSGRKSFWKILTSHGTSDTKKLHGEMN